MAGRRPIRSTESGDDQGGTRPRRPSTSARAGWNVESGRGRGGIAAVDHRFRCRYTSPALAWDCDWRILGHGSWRSSVSFCRVLCSSRAFVQDRYASEYALGRTPSAAEVPDLGRVARRSVVRDLRSVYAISGARPTEETAKNKFKWPLP